MKNQANITNMFPKHLFWDMDYSKLSISEDNDIIIPRALYATTEITFSKDIQKLEKLYTTETILNILRNTRERISNSVCELIAKRYNVEPFYRFKI